MQEFVGQTAEYLSALLGSTSEGKHLVYMGKAGTSSVGVSGLVNVPGLEDQIPPEIKASSFMNKSIVGPVLSSGASELTPPMTIS